LLTDVYADLKHKLTARGIPAHEIRFVHEAKTREARFRLFQAANDGLARVIVGSTAKLGTGVNVQKRLAALHHLDAPWRPMDVEHFVVSRLGSCVRQAVTLLRVSLNCVNGQGSEDSHFGSHASRLRLLSRRSRWGAGKVCPRG